MGSVILNALSNSACQATSKMFNVTCKTQAAILTRVLERFVLAVAVCSVLLSCCIAQQVSIANSFCTNKELSRVRIVHYALCLLELYNSHVTADLDEHSSIFNQ